MRRSCQRPFRRRAASAAACLGLLLVGLAGAASADRSFVATSDPLLQGWTASGNLTGSLITDPEFGLPVYEIDDASTAAGSALFFDAGGSEVPAPGEPWTMSARLRVVDLVDATDQSIFLEVTTIANRRFVLWFGSSDAPTSRTWIQVQDGAAGLTPSWFQSTLIDRTDYLRVDLASDGSEAHVFVNGRRYFGGSTITGFAQPSVPGRVLWGSGSSASTGHSRFAEVHYAFGVQECRNGLDDDGDGQIDDDDGDCLSPLDPREQGPVIPCDDGIDTDADGICDADESFFSTGPNLPDTDRDGLLDGAEATGATDPDDSDSDDDGVSDGIELAVGSDPNLPDSDGDGLLDGVELAVTQVFTTPAVHDGSFGGLAAGDAICVAEGNLQGVPNAANARAWLSDATADARDRIPPGPYVRFDPPIAPSTIAVDLADLTDGTLVDGIHSPSTATWTGTTPAGTAAAFHCTGWTTTAGGGIGGGSLATDARWTDVGVNLACTATRALMCFARDVRLGTDPILEDSDEDGLLDGDEVSTYATDPADADSDGDGFSDGDEVAAGTDPLDALDFPPSVPALGGLARGLLCLGLAFAVWARSRRR